MRYVDFDGVILDTEELLFREWRKNLEREKLPEEVKINYIKNSNWKEILNNSPVINDAIYILKNSSYKDYTILTKINSLENEGIEKIKYLRSNGVKQNIVLVPYELKKTDIVSAKGNILIDDCIKNLDDWCFAGGYPMFFDRKKNNIDSWNKPNTKSYQRVLRINEKASK